MDCDKEVIARAVRRDEHAFAEIYRTQSPKVFRYIYYMVGNRQEAEDLTGEVFLKAWEAIERYQDRGHAISTWLLRIAHNVTLKQMRRRPGVPIEDIELRDEGDSPHAVFERNVEAQAIRRAILTLPDVQRQVIICRFIHQMSHEEVQAVVGKSAGAVRIIQHRALTRLRDTMAAGAPQQSSARKARVAEAGFGAS